MLYRPLDIESVSISKESQEVVQHVAPEDPASAVSWDEPTIAEHDKLRGTRTKITEPKTPYHADASGASSDDDSLALSSSTASASGMDVDHASGDSSSRGESPRHAHFAVPPSHKKHHHGGDGHHHSGSDASGHKSHENDMITTATADDTDTLGLEPSKERKIRTSVDPIRSPVLDVSHLQNRMEQVKEERAIDDARAENVTSAKDEGEDDASSGSEDDDDNGNDDEFMTPQERAKKDAFAEKRKKHYDEFKRVKEFMSHHSDEGSSSDDEDDK